MNKKVDCKLIAYFISSDKFKNNFFLTNKSILYNAFIWVRNKL